MNVPFLSANGNTEAFVAVVPEPASLAVFALAFPALLPVALSLRGGRKQT